MNMRCELCGNTSQDVTTAMTAEGGMMIVCGACRARIEMSGEQPTKKPKPTADKVMEYYMNLEQYYEDMLHRISKVLMMVRTVKERFAEHVQLGLPIEEFNPMDGIKEEE